jgi:hypothetical protein
MTVGNQGYFSGRDGFVTMGRLTPNGELDTRKVAKVKNWAYDGIVRMLDASTLGDDADVFTPGRSGGTGSCELLYYRFREDEDLKSTHYQFTALMTKVLRRERVLPTDTVRLGLAIGPGSHDTILVDAYINAGRLRSAVGELTVVSIQFTATGIPIEMPTTNLGAPYQE